MLTVAGERLPNFRPTLGTPNRGSLEGDGRTTRSSLHPRQSDPLERDDHSIRGDSGDCGAFLGESALALGRSLVLARRFRLKTTALVMDAAAKLCMFPRERSWKWVVSAILCKRLAG
jgi:hypothetical protein